MEKVIIYGAGDWGKRVCFDIKNNYSNIEIIGFCDINKAGTQVMGYPVFSLEQLPKIDAKVIVAISDRQIVLEIASKLVNKGFNDIYYPLNKRKFYDSDYWNGNCVKLNTTDSDVLLYAEMQLVDYCNLNCKGCNHFSALYDRVLPNKEIRIADIVRLKEIFGTIHTFYMLGGEPLLNPEICDYIRNVRELLPNTELAILTNGLLIPNMSEEFFECVKENHIDILITEYESTHKIVDKIFAKLEEHEIDHAIFNYNSKAKFLKVLSDKKDSGLKPYCSCRGCVCVRDGKIARCPVLMYVGILNDKFGMKFPTSGIIDLNKPLEAKQLMESLSEKVELCDYCTYSEIDWETCGKQIKVEDFVSI